MSEDDSLFGLTTLQLFQLGVGVPAGVLTILDVAANNSAVITWICSMVWSGLFVSVKFWHVAFAGVALGGGWFVIQYTGWIHFGGREEENEFDAVRELLWRWRWSETATDGVGTPRPFCPKCDTELDIEDTRKGSGDDARCEVACTKKGCDFTKKWKMSPRDLRNSVRKEIARRKREGQYNTKQFF